MFLIFSGRLFDKRPIIGFEIFFDTSDGLFEEETLFDFHLLPMFLYLERNTRPVFNNLKFPGVCHDLENPKCFNLIFFA